MSNENKKKTYGSPSFAWESKTWTPLTSPFKKQYKRIQPKHFHWKRQANHKRSPSLAWESKTWTPPTFPFKNQYTRIRPKHFHWKRQAHQKGVQVSHGSQKLGLPIRSHSKRNINIYYLNMSNENKKKHMGVQVLHGNPKLGLPIRFHPKAT